MRYDEVIMGMMVISFDGEPTYQRIYEGQWITDGDSYGVVHRIASAGVVRGAGTACLEWALEQSRHLRIDTHRRNRTMRRLIAEISALLGEPEPFEIERKFLIEFPDLKWLESLPNCHKVDIIQTYLKAPAGAERRVRQRGENGSYLYYETIKKPAVGGLKRVEIERRLTQKEYLMLLMEADPDLRPIRKTRYLLTWEKQYFEIDLYPFWNDRAIVEIELNDEKAAIRFPKKLRVLKEVTEDPAYKNAALAARK